MPPFKTETLPARGTGIWGSARSFRRVPPSRCPGDAVSPSRHGQDAVPRDGVVPGAGGLRSSQAGNKPPRVLFWVFLGGHPHGAGPCSPVDLATLG